MFDQRSIEAFVMFEEEEVGEGRIDHVGVSPGELDELQALLPAVPAPPEGCGVLLRPRRARVGLHRHHVQADSVGSKHKDAENSSCWSSSRYCTSPNFVPSHGLQDRLGQVVGRHDDVLRIIRAAPGKDGMDFVCELPLFQRPVTQINKKLHIREPHLHTDPKQQ